MHALAEPGLKVRPERPAGQVQQVLLDGIPEARQVLIQGAGHAASIDRPEEFNRALLDFLTS